jgi:4-amino-4-deoxy-L-arabinose transferase-like glycosyltransferase
LRRAPLILGFAATLLACAAVYFPLLGATGLSNSEGHRAIPGWEMLERNEYLIPRLFGQAYLRKPPGMAWAVALSSFYLGQTEAAARAVSAISMTLLALLAVRASGRWFGPRTALWAGLAAALTPLFWPSGRSAEIEALNTLAAAGAVIFVLDLLLWEGGRGRRGVPIALGAALCIALGLFAKGPALLPALAGAVIAACLLRRSARVLANPGLWLALLLPAAAFLLYVLRVRAALAASGETPVLQGPSEFLWGAHELTATGILKVISMPAAALLSALPASLALLWVWGPRARAEALRGSVAPGAHIMARAVGSASLLSLVLLALGGVDNPRYALPSLGFLPVLAGYLALGHEGGFDAGRLRALRALQPRLWPVLLAAVAGLYILKVEPRSRASSGREAGQRLAEYLTPGAEVWADHLVEARPEVLWYAREAARSGGGLAVRWVPGMASGAKLPGPGGYVAVRTDAASGEKTALERAGLLGRLTPVEGGSVHKYTFVVYEVVKRGPNGVP